MENVYNLAASGDGKLYYLPSVRQEKAQMCWLYRSDIFEKLGLEVPKTTDEFLEACAKIKEAYPDKVIISSNGQKMSSLTGFFQAFGMPELILSDYSYYDPKDEEFVPYAMTTDNAREMFKFLKKLSDNNYIDKQILSMEKNEFTQRCSTDNAMITYNYVYNAKGFTKSSNSDENSTAIWSPTDTMITSNPNKGTVFKKDPDYSNWGSAFSRSIESEDGKLDAILKYYDWAATLEGQIFHTYGSAVPMRYTSEEESRFTDLATALDTKRDEYMARFLLGDMNPEDDNDWNQYISDMNRVGLQSFI